MGNGPVPVVTEAFFYKMEYSVVILILFLVLHLMIFLFERVTIHTLLSFHFPLWSHLAAKL